jgi:uncharacterized protein (UPF0218 family)
MGFYKITAKARKILGEPVGLLFPGPPKESIPKAIDFLNTFEKENSIKKNQRYITCVGDVVTESFFANSFLMEKILWAFIDGKTLRNENLNSDFRKRYRELNLTNPQGAITDEAISFIKKYDFNDSVSIVLIDGEEDLLVLPLTLELPDNYLIFYGQPPITSAEKNIPAGLGLVIVNEDLKSKTKNLLSEFERFE